MDILLSLKSLSFYVEHQKTIFLGRFCLKTSKDQISIFQLNSWVTSLEKSLIWRLRYMDILLSLKSLSFYVEHQKTIFLGRFCLKTSKDQISIFQLNSWVTSLEKSLIWRLRYMDILLSLKSLSFYVEHQKTIFLGRFCLKTSKDQISIFQLNSWVTSLEKSLIWRLCYMDILLSLKSLSFYVEHQKTIFLGRFCLKTSKDQISIFQLNSCVNPFGKITNMATL